MRISRRPGPRKRYGWAAVTSFLPIVAFLVYEGRERGRPGA